MTTDNHIYTFYIVATPKQNLLKVFFNNVVCADNNKIHIKIIIVVNYLHEKGYMINGDVVVRNLAALADVCAL